MSALNSKEDETSMPPIYNEKENFLLVFDRSQIFQSSSDSID